MTKPCPGKRTTAHGVYQKRSVQNSPVATEHALGQPADVRMTMRVRLTLVGTGKGIARADEDSVSRFMMSRGGKMLLRNCDSSAKVQLNAGAKFVMSVPSCHVLPRHYSSTLRHLAQMLRARVSEHRADFFFFLFWRTTLRIVKHCSARLARGQSNG